jgi:hypothetical protein
VSGIERGQRTRAELPAVLALAHGLDLDVGELLRGLKPDGV